MSEFVLVSVTVTAGNNKNKQSVSCQASKYNNPDDDQFDQRVDSQTSKCNIN